MADDEITLRDLFALKDGEVSLRPEHLEEALDAKQLMQKISKQARELRWASVQGAILEKVPELLNVKMTDVLLGAWKKFKMLQKYADRERYTPEETILVPLADHTVKSEHHPYVEILVGEQPIQKIAFDVSFELTLHGFVLSIQDAAIKGIQTGTWQGKGAIAFKGIVLVEKSFEPIELPGKIGLGRGISLSGLAAARGA